MTIQKMQVAGALFCAIIGVNVLQADLDLNKINSSSVKPVIKFDVLEQSLAKIEQQLADTAAQVQTLKAQVREVKSAAQEQMKADAEEKEKLLSQLQETQEAHVSLQQEVAQNEITVCLDQELSACLASTVIEPLVQEVLPDIVSEISISDINVPDISLSDSDEDPEEEYEDDL